MSLTQEKEKLVKQWHEKSLIHDNHVIDAFMKVPREEFVLPEYRKDAYKDYPLPILNNQTISQPSTVVIMTEHLQIIPGIHVLEVGSGSGYQAALISELLGPKGSLVTVEIDKDLAIFAHRNLKTYKNVIVVLAKENIIGYLSRAPYDRIIVTAAMPKIPQELLDQLKNGGILVAPVGSEYSQEMLVIQKIKGSLVNITKLGMFQFVPVKGKFGF